MNSLKPIFTLVLISALLFTALPGLVYSQEPVDYVNPNIGTIGHLLTATTPDVQLPRGMIRLIPTTTPGIRDVYLADKIYAFSAISLGNDFSRGVGAFSVMATTGNLKTNPGENASRFDHDLEKATPYYYTVLLEDYDIEAEFTATAHSAFYRFTFPVAENSNLLVSLSQNAELRILNDHVIEGFQTYPKGPSGQEDVFSCGV
jgi:putative alpha-1,2-mannosidase